MNIRSFGLKLRKAVATLSITTLLASLLVVAPANAAVAPAEPGFDWVPQEALALFDQARRAELNTYNLANTVTKAEAVVLGYRALGITGEFPVSPLTGVPEWAMQAFNAFYAKGFVKGEGNTTASGANNTLARVVLAQIACNALGVNPATAEKKTLTDAEKAEFTSTGTEWGMNCMAALAASANGEIFKQMRPADSVNRAEAATIWFRVGTKLGVTPGGSTPTEPTTPTTGGDLEVSVSDNNPDDARVPGSASNVEVAVFDFEAGKSDVTVTGVKLVRGGLGSDDVVTDIALFDADGFRLTSSKSFNSDDEAFMNFLGGGMKVPAGETMEVYVMAEVGAVVDVEGEEFFVAIEDAESVTATADEVSGDFPVEGAEIEIGGSDASEVVVTSGNSVANVNVGEQGVKVETFELEQDGDNDVILYGVNFKQSGSADEDTDLGSYELYIDGDKVAGPVEAKGEYVAFELEEGFVVEEGKNYDGEIRANVLGGASETIDFEIDETTDVRAEDEAFGFGAQVTVAGFNTADEVDIEAGEITVVAVDPENDEFREGQENIVLGTLQVTSLAGETVEAKKLEVVIEDSEGGAVDLDTVLENVEVVAGGSVYDLDSDGGVGDVFTFGNDDIDTPLPATGSLDFVVRADIIDDVAGLDNVTLDISVANIGGGTEGGSGFYFEETEDDEPVTDVTPSSLSFKSLEGTTSSATVTALNQSSSKSAVAGTKDVIAFGFEVDASSSSDILIDEIVISGTVVDDTDVDNGTDVFDNTRVAKLSLYVDEVKPENLVDTVSGSQIASQEATFESFSGTKVTPDKEVVVEADTEREFFVTLDIVDDVNQADDTIVLSIDADDISADDESSEDVDNLPAAEVTSTRTITVTGAGALSVTVDNSDTTVNRSKLVLGGTEAFVASYEVVAEDEDVIINDLVIEQTQAGVNLEDGVSKVLIYDQDKTTKLAEKTVTDNTVEFDNISLPVAEGSKNLYIKVLTHKIGKNLPGEETDLDGDYNLTMEITDADGASDNTVTVPAETGASLGFAVVPVQVTGVSFVSETPGGGFKVPTKLTNGENIVGIVKVVNASHSNTAGDTGTKLRTAVDQLSFDFTYLYVDADTDLVTTITDPTLERFEGSDDEIDSDTASLDTTSGADTVTFDTLSDFSSDQYIDAGETVYYILRADVVKDITAENDDFIKVELTDLNGGDMVYGGDNAEFGVGSITFTETVTSDGNVIVTFTKADGTTVEIPVALGAPGVANDTVAEISDIVRAAIDADGDTDGLTFADAGASITVTQSDVNATDFISVSVDDDADDLSGVDNTTFAKTTLTIDEARLNSNKATSPQLAE